MPAKPAAAKPKAKAEAAPTRVQPARTVKTKEYREAHRVSWGVHSHPHAKDPNLYYAMCLSALVQLRKEKRNATFPRVLEIVKSRVVAGAFSVRNKVRLALQKMIDSGRAQITARGVISLKSKRSTAAKKPAAKKTTKARTAAKKTAPKKKATTKKPTPSKKRSKKAAAAEVVEEAPAAKKSRRGKAKNDEKYHWEYKEGNMWQPYAPEASDIVEAAYQDYLNDPNKIDVRSVKSGMWAYQVDFTNMTQTNIQHENHTVRDIRRALTTA